MDEEEGIDWIINFNDQGERMKFIPEELQNTLTTAMKAICIYISDMSLFQDSFNLVDNEFELDEYDEEINEDSELKMFFPDYDNSINIQVKYIISLADELNKTKLIDDLECFSDNKYMLKVEAEEYQSLINLDTSLKQDNTGCIESGLCTVAILDSKKYAIRILRGSALFRLLYAKDNNMHDEAQSSDSDYFIEISSEQKIENIDIKRILNSYLFELATTMKIRLKSSPLPTFHYNWIMNYSNFLSVLNLLQNKQFGVSIEYLQIKECKCIITAPIYSTFFSDLR